MSKTILVIGASSGYGKGVADHLQSLGHRVLRASRSECLIMDVMSDDSVRDAFETIAPFDLDAVVYSAGLAIDKLTVEEGNPSDWNTVFQTNTVGLMRVAKAAMPHLKKSQGNLIAIGSIAAFISYVGGADYCASKAAANSIMKTLRYELLGTGVRTTSVEIGLGNTNFQFNRYAGDQQKAVRHYGDIRQIEPSDLGALVEHILELPKYLNIDEIVFKPIDQANHGVIAGGKNAAF